MLPIGLENMERIFPGIRQDFLEAGCFEYDEMAMVVTMSPYGWRRRVASEEGVGFRRPVLELAIRRRLQGIDNVEFIHASVRGLQADPAKTRVTGVELRDGRMIEADFVVNATGRRTKAIDWLADLGFGAPKESHLSAFMGYSTQFVKLPEDAFLGDVLGVVAPPWPGHHRGVAILPADNGLHAFTAMGMAKDYPSRDKAEIVEFLESGMWPPAADILRRSEAVTEFTPYHQDGTLMRHWHSADLPERFVTVGDAVASMNPIYGQGMSLSAVAASTLQDALVAADDLDGVGARVQKELGPVIEAAFLLTAGADAGFEGPNGVTTTFREPSWTSSERWPSRFS
ncbi:FAD-dependent oxidoreductase [Nocardioides sambongensis]|uniref:FAD-dependent oxidoreductase n=1 Tax=Nocardioides sambongensis TaxID=2589074 RepID=UPI0011295F8D|nr:FAD-dependent monooxygenase [Nocardioides sambongensis]